MKAGKRSDRPVAIVTGASGGFGSRIAVELARRGFVVAAALRSLEKSAPLLAMAERAGVADSIAPATLDVTDERSVAEATADVVRAHGRIDVLVNNAGYAQGGFVEDVPMSLYRAQFETNVWGAVAMTKAALPYMRAQRSGTIINMSSVSGRVALPGFSPYAASKHALEGFTESLRAELLPFGVYAVLVEPGSYRTGIWDDGFARMAGDPTSPYAKQLAAVRRAAERSARGGGDPSDVARLVAGIAVKRRPKLRYAIPAGYGLLFACKALLPSSWWDAIVARALR